MAQDSQLRAICRDLVQGVWRIVGTGVIDIDNFKGDITLQGGPDLGDQRGDVSGLVVDGNDNRKARYRGAVLLEVHSGFLHRYQALGKGLSVSLCGAGQGIRRIFPFASRVRASMLGYIANWGIIGGGFGLHRIC